ncbi:hypothetical protein ACFRAR_16670 [Kitasatospora sp. NPDC056651]
MLNELGLKGVGALFGDALFGEAEVRAGPFESFLKGLVFAGELSAVRG